MLLPSRDTWGVMIFRNSNIKNLGFLYKYKVHVTGKYHIGTILILSSAPNSYVDTCSDLNFC